MYHLPDGLLNPVKSMVEEGDQLHFSVDPING